MNKSNSGVDRTQRLQQRIVAALDANSQPDPAIEQRLNHARQAALAQRFLRANRILPALPWATMAAAAVLAVVLTFELQRPAGPVPMPMTADADLLTLPEFDLLVEDPELTAWLLEQEYQSEQEEQSG